MSEDKAKDFELHSSINHKTQSTQSPHKRLNLRNNYKIVTSYRREELVRESLQRITGKDLFDETMTQTIAVREQWDIWKHYVIEGETINVVDSQPEGYC